MERNAAIVSKVKKMTTFCVFAITRQCTVNDFFVADRFFWSTAFTVQPSTKYKIVPIFLLVATYNVQDYVLGPQIIVKREGKRPSKNELRRMSVLCTYMT